MEVHKTKFEIFSDELILRNLEIKSISDIKGLLELKGLRKLDLNHNQLQDIKG